MYPPSWIEPFMQLPRFFRFIKECLQGVIFAIFCLALPMAELFGLSALLASQEDQDNWYTLAGFLGGCLVIGATGVGMFFVARRVFKRWFS